MQNRDLWLVQFGILIGNSEERERARELGWPSEGMSPANLREPLSNILEERPQEVASWLRRQGFRVLEGQPTDNLRQALMLYLDDQMRRERVKRLVTRTKLSSDVINTRNLVHELMDLLEEEVSG